MNFDINMLSTLLNAFSSNSTRRQPSNSDENHQSNAYGANSRSQNASYNDAKRPKTHFDTQDEYQSGISPFVAQNGIGEQIEDVARVFSAQDKQNDAPNEYQSKDEGNSFESIVKMFAHQNGEQNNVLPMLELIKNMGSNKKGDVSSMLPMIMSLMQSRNNQQKTDKIDVDNVKPDEKINPTPTQADDACKNENCQNKKTQPLGKYSPIAFAGYPAICALHKLVSACN